MDNFIQNFFNAEFLTGLGKEVITSLFIIGAGILCSKVACKLLDKANAMSQHIEAIVSSHLKTIIRYAIFIICFIMILNTFGVNTASLLAVLGTAGVAIGLALKDTLSNIAAGLILLFLHSFSKGDFIEFNGITGTVKEMNLFATILETGDGIFISAPNSSVWGVPLKNYSRNKKRRMDLSICISYDDSIDRALRLLREIAEAEPRFLKDPAPAIWVDSLDNSAVNLLLRAWARSDDYWTLYRSQTQSIYEHFVAAGFHIPYPQHDVHLITH
jgi:small conductance mechanosensitive channel